MIVEWIDQDIRPSKLYKYESFAISELILTEQTLKFSDPKNFNDPFDCHIDNISFNLSGEIDERVKSDIKTLTATFGASICDNELLERLYKKHTQQKIANAKATCFSMDSNNELMWAHYGGSTPECVWNLTI